MMRCSVLSWLTRKADVLITTQTYLFTALIFDIESYIYSLAFIYLCISSRPTQPSIPACNSPPSSVLTPLPLVNTDSLKYFLPMNRNDPALEDETETISGDTPSSINWNKVTAGSVTKIILIKMSCLEWLVNMNTPAIYLLIMIYEEKWRSN